MTMLKNRQIWTWFEGRWQEGNIPIMGSADHGTWLGTLVFDGARWFDGVAPDLDKHCARMNHSAVALGLEPPMATATSWHWPRRDVKNSPARCRSISVRWHGRLKAAQ